MNCKTLIFTLVAALTLALVASADLTGGRALLSKRKVPTDAKCASCCPKGICSTDGVRCSKKVDIVTGRIGKFRTCLYGKLYNTFCIDPRNKNGTGSCIDCSTRYCDERDDLGVCTCMITCEPPKSSTAPSGSFICSENPDDAARCVLC